MRSHYRRLEAAAHHEAALGKAASDGLKPAARSAASRAPELRRRIIVRHNVMYRIEHRRFRLLTNLRNFQFWTACASWFSGTVLTLLVWFLELCR